MSGDLDLEQRYRRVLRLLPRYYRDEWEEDMVAAFLDGWLTGDPDEDSVTMEYDRPTRAGGRQRDRPGRPAVPGRRGRPAPLLRLGAGGAERGARGDAGHAVWGLGQARALRPEPPPDRLAPAARAGGASPGRLAARRVVRDRLRLDRGLRGAGPGGLPHRPGPRGPGPRRRPWPACCIGSSPAAWQSPLAIVGVLVADRPRPGPGHGRVPPGRPAGPPLALAAGAARVVPAGVRAGAVGRAVRPRAPGCRTSPGCAASWSPRLPVPRAEGLVRPAPAPACGR